MAAPRPGGQVDGWNDPPMLNFVSANTSPAPRQQRTLLNKRVGFPLSTASEGPQPNAIVPQSPDSAGMLLSPKSGPPKLPPVQILPPSASTSVNPPVPLLVTLSPPIDHSSLPPSFVSAIRDPQRLETLPELLERLELDSTDSLRKYTKKILHEMVDQCKDSIQGRSREDVQTRLGILDDQWREDKLSEGAKIKLGSLACALKNMDLKQADNLHLALMVDHISEVSQWMVGVKRLINELKLSASSPTTNNTRKLLFTSQDSSDDSSSVDVPKADSFDVCLDTVQFTNLKPVLMPEALVSSTAVHESVEGNVATRDSVEGNVATRDSVEGNVAARDSVQGNVDASDNLKGNVDGSLEKTEQQKMTHKEPDTDDKDVKHKQEENR